jgi:UDP-galactopyranose mutase
LVVDIVLFAFQPYDGRRGRDHHFARLLSQRHHVYYVEPPQSLLRVTEPEPGLSCLTPPGGLPFRNFEPIHWLNQRRWLAGLRRVLDRLGWRKANRRALVAMTPIWDQAYVALEADVAVYDAHDCWHLMPGNARGLLEKLYRVHATRATFVTCASQALRQYFQALGAPCEMLPNGCEFEHFAKSREVAFHPDWQGLPRPRLVYFGGMDACFAADEVFHAAQALPRATFVLVGPVFSKLTRLAALPNVRFWGLRPYAALPSILAGADGCLLPYRLNEWGIGRDSIKLYEYLASGLPSASTRFPRALDFEEHLYVADEDTPDAFAAACAKVLSEREAERQARAEARRREAREHDWVRRVETLCALLEGDYSSA